MRRLASALLLVLAIVASAVAAYRYFDFELATRPSKMGAPGKAPGSVVTAAEAAVTEPAKSPKPVAAAQRRPAVAPEAEKTTASEELGGSPPIYMGIYAGKVGLFEGGLDGREPYRKFDIDASLLPEDVAARLRAGLRVSGDEEALALLEGWQGMLD